MLWTVIVVLLVLWFLGFVGNFGGDLIHAILVIAGIIFLFQIMSGRRV